MPIEKRGCGKPGKGHRNPDQIGEIVGNAFRVDVEIDIRAIARKRDNGQRDPAQGHLDAAGLGAHIDQRARLEVGGSLPACGKQPLLEIDAIGKKQFRIHSRKARLPRARALRKQRAFLPRGGIVDVAIRAIGQHPHDFPATVNALVRIK